MRETLTGWVDFYLITGTAAAALTGLQFIVQTLLASDLGHSFGSDDAEGGISAFGTPTVVHFAMALVISAVMCAPWPDHRGLRASLDLMSASAVVYTVIVLFRARRQKSYVPTAYDWFWYFILPFVSYAVILTAGMTMSSGGALSFFMIAAATMLLLCIGIHNAWDTVTFLTVSAWRRANSGHGQTQAPPDRPDDSSEKPRSDKFSDIVVRTAKSTDLASIGRLGAQLVRLHHEFDSDRFMLPGANLEEGYASFLKTQIDKPNIVVLVAERDDHLMGYTYAGMEGVDYMSLRGPAGIVYDIVVDPAYRGHGVGDALLDATMKELESRGAPRVILSTAEHNKTAQEMFAHAGFRRTMIEMTREMH